MAINNTYNSSDVKHFLKWQVWLPIFFVLIIVAIVFFLYQEGYFSKKLSVDKNVIATVGDQKITINDLKNRAYGLSFDKNQKIDDATKKMLIDELIEQAIVLNAADQMGIAVTQKEKEDRSKSMLNYYDKLTDKQKSMVLKNMEFQIKKEKITLNVVSKIEGQFINIRFDRHFQEMVPGTDADRKKDHDYAENLANDLYSKMISGNITFEAAMDQVNNDKVIDISTYPGVWPKQADSFVSGGYPTYHEPFMQKISGLKVGEITKPFELSQKSPGGDKLPPSSFMIAKVTKTYGGSGVYSYAEWLDKEKQKLKVKTY